ncbi:tetratricopeptide repeat protein [Chryseolinea lacunae]|uniref:Tetratricopeptide repeat protein n=1 Tax=Chryseolinea lacunae TaxID=2801331 RepID=A0ABS1L137_9BACT|nr:tetratricopeptide repeat protein [Chryseolinea lacunae]MBL0745405.1 tetratricopeptide repeat protein [Chryseolinea lacunae]
MATENDILLVEKYFDDELTAVEKEQVMQRVAMDVQFKTLFDQEKVLIRAIRHQGLRENLTFLKTLESNIDQQTPASRSFKWYYLAAALAGTLAIVTFLVNRPDDPQQLFQSYFKPYPNVFEPTVRGTEATTPRAEAFQAYEQGDYAKAAEQLEALYVQHPEPEVLMLLGNTNLMLGHITEAENNFITLNHEYDGLDVPAQWYLSLCYLKRGEVQHARTLLKKIEGTENSYASKAKELLEKLN